ncbi:unnamed protein product [Arctogadus glacialis]
MHANELRDARTTNHQGASVRRSKPGAEDRESRSDVNQSCQLQRHQPLTGVTADMGQRWVAASAFIVRQIVNADIRGPGSLVMEGLTSLKLGSRAHRASSGPGPVGPGNEGRSSRPGPPSPVCWT